MNKTSNYQLNQWAKSDQVRMEDFNADNAKIDAALGGLAQGKADKTALAALTQTVTGLSAQTPKIAAGTYTGNGAAERTISLPFTPKAVYICTSYGAAFINNGSHTTYLGGLILSSEPLNVSGNIYGKIVAGGVQLHHKSTNSITYSTNLEGTKYTYLALSW